MSGEVIRFVLYGSEAWGSGRSANRRGIEGRPLMAFTAAVSGRVRERSMRGKGRGGATIWFRVTARQWERHKRWRRGRFPVRRRGVGRGRVCREVGESALGWPQRAGPRWACLLGCAD